MPLEKSEKKSVFTWGWMSLQGGGFLHRFNETLTSEKYVQILENYLVPYAWARFGPTEDELFTPGLVRRRGKGVRCVTLVPKRSGHKPHWKRLVGNGSINVDICRWMCSTPQAATNCRIRFTISGITLATIKITGKLFATRCLVDLQWLGKLIAIGQSISLKTCILTT